MSELDWITVIAVAEFAAILLLTLGLVAYFALRGRRDDTTAAWALIDKVTAAETEHRKTLQAHLEQAGLSGGELQSALRQLLVLEQRFYEHCIRTYLTRDRAALLETDDKLQQLLQSYLDHAGAAAPTEAEPPTEADEAPPEADPALKERFSRLSEDLIVYRNTLNRVFSEYTAMFGVHLDTGQQLSASEILNRLESGNLSGEQEAAGADAETTADGV